jgi:hypothetical protein
LAAEQLSSVDTSTFIGAMHIPTTIAVAFDFRVVKRLLPISQAACSNLSSALTRSISAMAFFSLFSPRRLFEKAIRPLTYYAALTPVISVRSLE